MYGRDLGSADPLQWICRKWVQELGFDEATVNAEVRDDRVGAKNTELDGLTVQREELPVREYEFSSGLIHQEHDGGICAPPPKETKTNLHNLWADLDGQPNYALWNDKLLVEAH